MSRPSLRVSARVRRDLSPNRLAEALAGLRGAGAPILDLTVSNPTRCGLPYPEAEIRNAFAEGSWMAYEPDPSGRADAREAVAKYYEERGIAADPGRVVLTASTSEAYAYLFKMLTEPGDRVLVPRPSYPLFEFLGELELCELDTYELAYTGEWSVDLGSVEAALRPNTRALVVVHPNNPTGSFLRPAEHAALGALCSAHGLVLIADEVFADYGLGPQAHRLLPGPPEVLSAVLNGLSKILALPQVKLGWMVLDGPEERVGPALAALELIADTYLSVGTPVQAALPRLLALRSRIQQPILERIRTNLATLGSVVPASSPCSALPVGGGWSVVLRVPATRSSEDWALEALCGCGVMAHPGSFYGFGSEAHLVLSLLPRPEVFAAGAARLVELCSES